MNLRMEKNNLDQHKGFKLISLELVGHNILGSNTFNFVDPLDKPESIYTTVIIGPNGTGKSELLSVILYIFRNICSLDLNDSFDYISGRYRLKYKNNNTIYEISNITDGLNFQSLTGKKVIFPRPKFFRNSEEIDFNKAINTLPEAIVANSIMLTDKFIVPRNDKEQSQFPMYKYLGVRNRPSQASTRSYVRKTIEFVVDQIESKVFKEGLEKIADYLGLSKSISVIYYTTNTPKFFTGNLNKINLDDYFAKIDKQYAGKEQIAPFKLSNYKAIVKNDPKYIEQLCDFINSLIRYKRLYPVYNSSAKIIPYDVTENSSHKRLRSEYRHLDIMRRIGLLKPPEIKFGQRKSDEIENLISGYFTHHNNIDLQDTSSGEFHFFSTMVGLMATIKPNSLILIDEPEISLHPNWQMQYLQFVRQLFSDDVYQTCHIIIATHSHFLVSDLKEPSSKIIGLNKIEGRIGTKDINTNTFGWSAEDVLYNIFNVRSSLNYYLEADLTELLGLIAMNSKDIMRLKEILDKLVKLPQRDNDPLQEIILEAKDYIKQLE